MDFEKQVKCFSLKMYEKYFSSELQGKWEEENRPSIGKSHYWRWEEDEEKVEEEVEKEEAIT